MKKKQDYSLLLFTTIIGITILLFFIPNIVEYFNPQDKEPILIYINQKDKIQKHQIDKKEEETREDKDHRKLFELYFQGINEKYDNNGNKIPGIEPNPDKAIYHLKKLIDSIDGNNNDVLRLAKIYHQGMHNLEPNLDEAEKIYTAILNNCGELDIRNEAQDGIDNISRIKALEWLNLPLDHDPQNPQQRMVPNIVQPEFLRNTNRYDNRPTVQDRWGLDVNDIFEIIDDDTFNINRILMHQYEVVDNNIDNIPVVGTKQYNDPQNVHDPQVISTVKNSIKTLKNNTNNNSNYNNIYMDVLQYIQTKSNGSKKQDAIKSLNKINNSNQHFTHGDISMSEQEALQLVWNRIKDPIFDNNRDNVKDILVEELASMQEYDQTICPTGRFVRIIDTLNVVDPNVSIKPKYAINEEMMNKSAKIREKLLENQSDKELLERGTSPNQHNFDNLLKETITSELEKDYVQTNILTPAQFTVEISKWIDFI